MVANDPFLQNQIQGAMAQQAEMAMIRVGMIQSIVGHLAAVDFRAALEQAHQQASPEQRAAGQLNFRLQVENVAKIAVAYADATMATVFRPKG